MPYDQISEEVLADAAFAAGLMSGRLREELVPMPARVDGMETIIFCIKASPIGQSDLQILHPVLIVPHEGMIIQDRRNGASAPLSRVPIMPLDVRHARYHRAALSNPESFFGKDWGK